MLCSSHSTRLGDDQKVFTAEEVLMGKQEAGASTVIIGGGLVGYELALWLRRQGKNGNYCGGPFAFELATERTPKQPKM
ncbi:hypothetical protein P22_2960 [Propionispora sp. 2/2-37]|uniref:hypothetical protein n=1 Tax=Propionispora sp. 2/2-37 TaxID=1677858 RepID=UPI0006BB6EE1|nr:hypothetical protein [Propionispora sp. 2/2-37]CUH96849.1 hypothetical protein P22_2960 [Propionispora sp. 2/2-37]